MQKDCAVCGGRFTAKRAAALYCSDRCRKRAQRAPAAPPARREGAALIALPTPPVQPETPAAIDEGLLATTERALRDAERLSSPDGQAAMFLARVLESGGAGQTGSSIASLIREHRAALSKALEGAKKADTPLERLRKQREQRKAIA